MNRLNTVGKAWLVCSVGMDRGHRFTDKELAFAFSRRMSVANPHLEYEVFECAAMVYADVPVKTVTHT